MKRCKILILVITFFLVGCSKSEEVAPEETAEVSDKITVKVKDLTPPVISVEDKFEVTLNDDFQLKEKITVKDNVDKDIGFLLKGDFDTSKPGTYVVTVFAKDHSGNASNKEVTIEVSEPKKEVKPQTTSDAGTSSTHNVPPTSPTQPPAPTPGPASITKDFLFSAGYTMSGGSNPADIKCNQYILEMNASGYAGGCRILTDENGAPNGMRAELSK